MKKYYDIHGKIVNVVKVAKPIRNNVALFNKNASMVAKKAGKVNKDIGDIFVNNFDARMTDEKATELINTAVISVEKYLDTFQNVTLSLIESTSRDAEVMVRRTLRIFGVDLKNVPMVKNFTGQMALDASKVISKISEGHAKIVGDLFLDTLKNGNGLKDFKEKLGEVEGLTLKNVEQEALNVSRRSFNQMSKDSMTRHGIDNAIWNHNGGSMNPRPEHEAMDGKIFSLSNPPECCGLPGQYRHCHCSFTPVIKI